jgi:hypothetical protein
MGAGFPVLAPGAARTASRRSAGRIRVAADYGSGKNKTERSPHCVAA